MPDIVLHEPKNSRFHSSLNEVDLAMREILLNQMRIADPRDITGEPDKFVSDTGKDYLWDYSRVFQVDDLDTEEIFDTYLLRKQVNGQTNTDVSYPLCAFKQEDIDTVFWGTGNRVKQHYIELESDSKDFEVNDEVVIAEIGKYRGYHADIFEIKNEQSGIYCKLMINGKVLQENLIGGKRQDKWFNTKNLRLVGEKTKQVYKAKAITGKYSVAVLADNRDEIQYIRDHFILRCADGQIWHRYPSPTLGGAENQVFTVFGIPNIDRYPTSKDKLKGKGYIYATAFKVDFWAALTDTPLPQSLIETIRMNIHVEKDGPVNRIVIND